MFVRRFTIDPDKNSQSVSDVYDSSIVYDISSGSINVKAGTALHLYVDISEIDIFYPEMDYEFSGIYINGVKAVDENLGGSRPTNVYDIQVLEDTEVRVCVSQRQPD